MSFTFDFRPAVQEKSLLRMGLSGVPGAGKTFSAIKVAALMLGGKPLENGGVYLERRPDGRARIAFVDTERDTARKYTHVFPSNVDKQAVFDVLSLPRNDQGAIPPDYFIQAIASARRADYEFLIIDSLSHAWEGILDMKDKVDAAKRAKGGYSNDYANWREVTPVHNDLVDDVLTYPGHVICCMRMKMERVQEKEGNRTVIRNVGMKEIQRDGMAYEFDLTADMEVGHAIFTKSRCHALPVGTEMVHPGLDLAVKLTEWLETGVEPAPKPMARREFVDAALGLGFESEAAIGEALRAAGAANLSGDNKFDRMLEALKASRTVVESPALVRGKPSKQLMDTAVEEAEPPAAETNLAQAAVLAALAAVGE